MTLQEMTHTCYRCRHSWFAGIPATLDCPFRKRLKQEGECDCKNWEPSLLAVSYFDGSLKSSTLKSTISYNYLQRVKAGTF